MRWMCIAVTWLVLSPIVVHAGFPYEAEVVVPQTDVRSGAGEKFYSTARLSQGDRVQVYRHDVGWTMIGPPADSFHWIAAKHVATDDGRIGVVREHNVPAWVGSLLSTAHDVRQRSLRRGEEVSILGKQQVVSSDGRSELFYKIKPPPRMYRWIKSPHLAPVAADPSDAGGLLRAAVDNPPSKVRHVAMQFGDEPTSLDSDSEFPGASTPEPIQEATPVRTAARPTEVPEWYDGPTTGRKSHINYFIHEKLEAIDDQLDEMLLRESTEWDFTSVENQYLELKERNNDQRYTKVIDGRLTRVARLMDLKQDHAELRALAEQTMRRDVELRAHQETIQQRIAARQSGQFMEPTGMLASQPSAMIAAGHNVGPIPNLMSGPVANVTSGPIPNVGQSAGPQLNLSPQSHVTSAMTPQPNAPVANAAGAATVSPPAYSGAGIVQRMPAAPGSPQQYVLAAPDGRVLAWLSVPGGTSLENWVGRPAGIVGPRGYRPEVQGDVIMVQRLDAVQLAR